MPGDIVRRIFSYSRLLPGRIPWRYVTGQATLKTGKKTSELFRLFLDEPLVMLNDNRGDYRFFYSFGVERLGDIIECAQRYGFYDLVVFSE